MGYSAWGHEESDTAEHTAHLPTSAKYTLNVVPRGPMCLAQAWSDRIAQVSGATNPEVETQAKYS